MSGAFTLHPFAIFESLKDCSLQFNILHWPYSIRTFLSLIYMTFQRNNQPSSVLAPHGANNTKVMELIPVWAVRLRVGLDDPCRSLSTQNILWFVNLYGAFPLKMLNYIAFSSPFFILLKLTGKNPFIWSVCWLLTHKCGFNKSVSCWPAACLTYWQRF